MWTKIASQHHYPVWKILSKSTQLPLHVHGSRVCAFSLQSCCVMLFTLWRRKFHPWALNEILFEKTFISPAFKNKWINKEIRYAQICTSFKTMVCILFYCYFHFCNLQVMLSTITVVCSLRIALWTYLSLRRVLDLQIHLINRKGKQESWAWPAQTVKTPGQLKACHQHASPTVSEALCPVLLDMATALPFALFLWNNWL